MEQLEKVIGASGVFARDLKEEYVYVNKKGPKNANLVGPVEFPIWWGIAGSPTQSEEQCKALCANKSDCVVPKWNSETGECVYSKNGMTLTIDDSPTAQACLPDEVVWEPTTMTQHTISRDGTSSSCTSDKSKTDCLTKYCSKLLPGVDCDSLGTVPAFSVASIAPHAYDGRQYECRYRKADVASSCKATTAYTEYGRDVTGDPKWFDQELMQEMCSTRADPKSCPPTSSSYKPDGKEITCANMIACPLCREWVKSDQGKDAADAKMRDWCTNHTDMEAVDDPTKSDPACQCINGVMSEKYERIAAAANSENPGCWYTPCKDPEIMKYMVPSEYREPKLPCPTSCTINWNIIDSSDIDIDDVYQYIEGCNIIKPDPKPEPDDDDDDENVIKKWFKENKKTILIGSGAIVIMACVGLLAKRYMKK